VLCAQDGSSTSEIEEAFATMKGVQTITLDFALLLMNFKMEPIEAQLDKIEENIAILLLKFNQLVIIVIIPFRGQ